MTDPHHRPRPPDPVIAGWARHVPAGGAVLDVAAGGGRHAQWFAARGHAVVAVDRDTDALRVLRDPRIEIVTADLEAAPWPFPGRRFAGVVVVDYLWRDLLPILVDSVAPGGALLYATFAAGNERFGRPSNPAFLLRPGELLEAARGSLEVREYRHGECGEPPVAVRQWLLAVRPV